jgi:hypothetical protein
MVLEAPDYGFIGLKLKGLIFQESGNMEHGALNMLIGEGRWRRKMASGG